MTRLAIRVESLSKLDRIGRDSHSAALRDSLRSHQRHDTLSEPREWLLLYLFVVVYTVIHIISWVQTRYRMPVDVALVPFAALAAVLLVNPLLHARERDRAASLGRCGPFSRA